MSSAVEIANALTQLKLDSYLYRIRLQRHRPDRIRRTDRPLGNSGVGIIESPGYWQIDTALIKQLPLPSERFQVYLFLNGTNILNHPLGDPSSIEITAVPTRGRIPGIRADGNASGIGVRQMQFGLRVKF